MRKIQNGNIVRLHPWQAHDIYIYIYYWTIAKSTQKHCFPDHQPVFTSGATPRHATHQTVPMNAQARAKHTLNVLSRSSSWEAAGLPSAGAMERAEDREKAGLGAKAEAITGRARETAANFILGGGYQRVVTSRNGTAGRRGPRRRHSDRERLHGRKQVPANREPRGTAAARERPTSIDTRKA